MNAKELLKQVEAVWTQEMEERSGRWAAALLRTNDDGESTLKQVEKATSLFREWAPLYFYTSITRASDSKVTFSLRFEGQEVAILEIDPSSEKVWLNVDPKMAGQNTAFIERHLEGKWAWDSADASEFRRLFRKLASERQPSARKEHSIESEFLRQMRLTDASKFSGTLRNIQPVLLAGCPFQFPVPLSACDGMPKTNEERGTKGNIDILARRGVNRLSVWELKKPGSEEYPSKPIEQAYIYSVALLKMLRSPNGHQWYKLLGYSGELPKKLVVESIAAVCPSDPQMMKFQRRFDEFMGSSTDPLIVSTAGHDDEIRPLVAYYKLNPLRFDPPLTR